MFKHVKRWFGYLTNFLGGFWSTIRLLGSFSDEALKKSLPWSTVKVLSNSLATVEW